MRVALLIALGIAVLAVPAGVRPVRAQTPPRDAVARPTAPPTDRNSVAGTIGGRVIADGSDAGVPLAKAYVEITGDALTTQWMFTNSLGEFEFGGLPAGRYTLVADKTGYAVTTYGARGRFDPPTQVAVADGATETVEIRMPKGAAIAGRIVDDSGDPVIGARVSALVLRTEGDTRRLETVTRAASETDDRGEYRVGGLAAGQYLLSVAAERDGILITPTYRRMGWARTFFPAGGASPIALMAGEERAGLDISLSPFRPAELTVSVIAAPDPALRGATTMAEAVRLGVDPSVLRAMPQGTLSFFSAETPDVQVPGGSLGFSVFGGAAQVQTLSIDPGPWTLIARRAREGAIAHLLLSPSEISSMSIPLRGPSRFSGQIVFDGASRRPAPPSVLIDVIGAGPDTGISPLALAPSGPFAPKVDGNFEITAILGTIEVLVEAPGGWTVSRIAAGDQDYLGRPITFEGGETLSGVRIVLSDQVAEVEGTLQYADERPAPGCLVAVFPAAPDARFNRYRMQLGRADLEGRFLVGDLPPGDYLAATASDIDAGDWTSPASIDRLRSGATAFTLGARDKKSLTLHCAGAR